MKFTLEIGGSMINFLALTVTTPTHTDLFIPRYCPLYGPQVNLPPPLPQAIAKETSISLIKTMALFVGSA